MARAKGRGRHGPPAGRDREYLYYATGQGTLEGHQEQLEAADDVEGTEIEPPVRVDLGPGGSVTWSRATPRVRRVPRGPESLAHEYGLGDSQGIPGGLNHNDANPKVVHQEPPYPPDLSDFRGMMAHGVPPTEVGVYQRDAPGPRKVYEPEYAKLPPAITPVPVYVVEGGAGPKPKAAAAFHRVTAPAATGQPVLIAGQNLGQSLIQLLNEDSTHNCRVGTLADLVYDAANTTIIGGCRVPANATGYTVLRTQAPLYLISETSSTPVVSVILEYEVAEAG